MIFVGTHHKMGTMLLTGVLTDICRSMELRLVMDFQSAVTDDTDVWFMTHSRIDDPLPIRRGVHIVRHPIAVIHSAYRYHQVCSESWAIDPTRATHADGIRYDFSGISYQQKLRSLSLEDGLCFEMLGRSYNAIMDAYRFDYSDPAIATVRMEDISADFDAAFTKTFEWLGLPAEVCLPLARVHDLSRKGRVEIMAMAHVTNKTLEAAKPKLPAAAQALFEETFPADLLARLGY